MRDLMESAGVPLYESISLACRILGMQINCTTYAGADSMRERQSAWYSSGHVLPAVLQREISVRSALGHACGVDAETGGGLVFDRARAGAQEVSDHESLSDGRSTTPACCNKSNKKK